MHVGQSNAHTLLSSQPFNGLERPFSEIRLFDALPVGHGSSVSRTDPQVHTEEIMHRTMNQFARIAKRALLAMTITLLPSAVLAQHGGGASGPAAVAPKEGTQFDFLVGQWELTAVPKANTLAQRIHGVAKLSGTWKAWRALDGWGIEDELRLTDASGNPLLFAHHVRYFESAKRRWNVSGVDVYKGVLTTSSAEWKNGEMTQSGTGTETDGRAYLSRAVFSKLTPSSFSYRLDRSYDNGKEWTQGVTRIDAKRVAASAPR